MGGMQRQCSCVRIWVHLIAYPVFSGGFRLEFALAISVEVSFREGCVAEHGALGFNEIRFAHRLPFVSGLSQPVGEKVAHKASAVSKTAGFSFSPLNYAAAEFSRLMASREPNDPYGGQGLQRRLHQSLVSQLLEFPVFIRVGPW